MKPVKKSQMKNLRSSDSSVSPLAPAVCSPREAAAPTPEATAEIAAATASAGAASYEQPSELDQGALQQVFIRLPRNVQVLAAKVLSKGWRDWVYQQLGSRRGRHVVVCREDLQSSFVPLWSIKQQVGLWINPLHKAWLALGAAIRGELEDLQWMISQGYGKGSWYQEGSLSTRNMEFCGIAAEAGQLRVLEWLVSEGYEIDASTCNAAAKGGQLEVLRWLTQKGPFPV